MASRDTRRVALAEAQNWRCAYCHCSLELRTMTIEHVVPRFRGGRDCWLNTVAACEPCNTAGIKKPKFCRRWKRWVEAAIREGHTYPAYLRRRA